MNEQAAEEMVKSMIEAPGTPATHRRGAEEFNREHLQEIVNSARRSHEEVEQFINEFEDLPSHIPSDLRQSSHIYQFDQ